MFNQYFYHQKIRKSVAIFGALFNNIYIVRKDANGEVINTQRVPLSYAPKEKYLARILQSEDLRDDTSVAIKLPRMSFEMTTLAYDETRQLPKTNKRLLSSTDSLTRKSLYTPIPYYIIFSLNIFSKTQDDALQIVEQILPYFSPQYTLSIKPFAEYSDIVEDIPVTLQSVAFSDDYEGAVESRRTIIYTLDFEMKVSFSGPIGDGQKIITKAITEFDVTDKSLNNIFQKLIVTPDPINIIGDSDYGFNTDIINYLDSDF